MTVRTVSTVPCGASRRVSARCYRRRRTAVAIVLSGSLSALALVGHGVLTGPGGDPASAAGAATAPAPRHVIARPGDSLWAIAEREHAATSFQGYLEALIDLNGGTAIEVGQVVRLP